MTSELIMKLLLFLFTSLLLSGCNTPFKLSDYYYEEEKSNNLSEPGKCYAKCLMPKRTEVYVEEVYLYTGDPNDKNAAIEIIEYESSPEKSDWVKRVLDKNCQSNNSDDCFTRCMLKEPSQHEKLIIVTDTIFTKEFVPYEIAIGRVIYLCDTEWMEVICPHDLTPDLVREIKSALKSRGFQDAGNSDSMDSYTKEVLVSFQKKNALPVGQLDIETLKALGIHK